MNKLLLTLLLLCVTGLLLGGLTLLYHLPLDTRDRSPQQPLPFSHLQHAGNLQIDCRFCHRHAETGPVAGVPDLDLCLSCHRHIATDKPAIQQLAGYWDRQEPVPWVRLHQLPDHVYFPHNLHLRAQVECGYCHGQVESMAQMQRIASLKMGWCLNCHRQNQASIDCWTCHM